MTDVVHFVDRHQAGEALAQALDPFRDEAPIVLGLTRGGVSVATVVAQALNAPLDMLVVQKIGAPSEPELGLGALAEGDVQVIDTVLCQHLGVGDAELRRLSRAHADALDARIRHYRQEFPRHDLRDRLVILVDDGLATGSTAHAAIRSARRAGARHVILAVPVGSVAGVRQIAQVADDVICLSTPEVFGAVGFYYDDFPQLSDRGMLEELTHGTRGEVAVPVGEVLLQGILSVPHGTGPLVVFAHGSGSSRLSPRNQEVAQHLNQAGMATLLIDLLTEDEAAERAQVFDIEHLADRLEGVLAWTRTAPRTSHLGVSLFGASTGAAAAIAAAARCPEVVRSVVSRGGRIDLARRWLPLVQAPTLLIVGGDDVDVLRLNREASAHMRCQVSLKVIPGASHLFEEPGALDQVANLARDWFAATAVSHAA